jgi:hypothetical protein
MSMGTLEEPAPGADPLEPIRNAVQEAGSQVVSALSACSELPPDSPEVADFQQWLGGAALLLAWAEVRSYPLRQSFGRLILERTEFQEVPLRAAWRVVDEAGAVVGIVIGQPKWLGRAHDRPTFTVAHNPTGGQREAAWTSAGHPSPTLAVAALVDHLERR